MTTISQSSEAPQIYPENDQRYALGSSVQIIQGYDPRSQVKIISTASSSVLPALFKNRVAVPIGVVSSASLQTEDAVRAVCLNLQREKFQSWKHCYGGDRVDRFVPVQEQEERLFTNDEMKHLFKKIYFISQYEPKYGLAAVRLFVPCGTAPVDLTWAGIQIKQYWDERQKAIQALVLGGAFKDAETTQPGSHLLALKQSAEFVDFIAGSPEAFVERAEKLREDRLASRHPDLKLENDPWKELVLFAARLAPLSARVELYRELERQRKNGAEFLEFMKGVVGDPEDVKFIVRQVFPHYASGEMALNDSVKADIRHILEWMSISRSLAQSWRNLFGFDRLDGAHRPLFNVDVLKDHLNRQLDFQSYLQFLRERSSLEQLNLRAGREKLTFDCLARASLSDLQAPEKQFPQSQKFIKRLMKKASAFRIFPDELFRASSAKRSQFMVRCSAEIERFNQGNPMMDVGAALFEASFLAMHKNQAERLAELSHPDRISMLEKEIARVTAALKADSDNDDLQADLARLKTQLGLLQRSVDRTHLDPGFQGICVMPVGDILYGSVNDNGEPYIEGKWVVADLRDLNPKQRIAAAKQVNAQFIQQQFANPTEPILSGQPLYFDLDKNGLLIRKKKSGSIVLYQISPKNVFGEYQSRELGTRVRIKLQEDNTYKYVNIGPDNGKRALNDGRILTAAVDSQMAIWMGREMIARFMAGRPTNFKVFQNAIGHIFIIHNTDLAQLEGSYGRKAMQTAAQERRSESLPAYKAQSADPVYSEAYQLSTSCINKFLTAINQNARVQKTLVELETSYDAEKDAQRLKGISETIRLYSDWAKNIDLFLQSPAAQALSVYADRLPDIRSALNLDRLNPDLLETFLQFDKQSTDQIAKAKSPEEQRVLIEQGLEYIKTVLMNKKFQSALFFLGFCQASPKCQIRTREILKQNQIEDTQSFENMIRNVLTFYVWTSDLLKKLLEGGTELSEEFCEIYIQFINIQEELRGQEIMQSRMKQEMLAQPPEDPRSAMRLFAAPALRRPVSSKF